ncbi:MAG: DUF5683 domain-containing protein [Bacteroidota bacterium]
MKSFLLIILLLSSAISHAQEKDSLDLVHPIPKKATLYSAVLPGAGQVYNKKYWKVPIVYIGLGIAGYALRENLKNLDFFKTELIYTLDGDPNTVPTSNLSSEILRAQVNQYKNWRDWSYVSLGIIYALNIIDANVDAHLSHFDVSENLSLEIHPYFNTTVQRSQGISLVLKL